MYDVGGGEQFKDLASLGVCGKSGVKSGCGMRDVGCGMWDVGCVVKLLCVDDRCGERINFLNFKYAALLLFHAMMALFANFTFTACSPFKQSFSFSFSFSF